MRTAVVLITALVGLCILPFLGGWLLMLAAGIVFAEFAWAAPIAFLPAVGLFTVTLFLLATLRAKTTTTTFEGKGH